MFSKLLSTKFIRCKIAFYSPSNLKAFSKTATAFSLNEVNLNNLFNTTKYINNLRTHEESHPKPTKHFIPTWELETSLSKKINLMNTHQKTPLILLEKINNKGKGVLAGTSFKKNTEVLQFFGDIQDRDAYDDLTYALQIGPREFISASGDYDDYVNHSCEPNCGLRETEDKRIVLVALREIHENEEITFDYAMSQSGRFLEFECQCGAPSCRGMVRDFVDLPKETQESYAEKNVVLPYLLKDSSL